MTYEAGTPAEFHELYEYNRWANRRTLEAASALDPDAFTRELESSFSSVRATLAHILGAEWIWLRRWLGHSPSGFPHEWDLSSFDALARRWERVEEAQREYVEGLTDWDLQKVVEYSNTDGEAFKNPLPQLLRHVVNHSTYHRGQVTTLLRRLGAEPASTDLILFHRERTGAGSSGQPGS